MSTHLGTASEHPFFKLGKATAKRDERNLLFKSISLPVKVPTSYDFDDTHPHIPMPMFGNDTRGDCVIAARAHASLRFELVETGKLPVITENEVLTEYFKESGGADSGLVMLDSLKAWRSSGWTAGGRVLTIDAFTEVDRKSKLEVKRAIFTRMGVDVGLSLPLSAQRQIQTGVPWDTVTGPSGAPGSWGGHCVWFRGYTPQGPLCITWGRVQHMTWRFFAKYCDEAYLVIDSVDRPSQGIDRRILHEQLAALK